MVPIPWTTFHMVSSQFFMYLQGLGLMCISENAQIVYDKKVTGVYSSLKDIYCLIGVFL